MNTACVGHVAAVWLLSTWGKNSDSMPVPAVSPKKWKRTTIIAHFAMAVPISVVRDFSFQDRVKSILDDRDDGFISAAREYEKDDSDYVHGDFGEPHEKQLRLEGRDSDHRPRVDENAVKLLDQAVRQEKENLPVEKMDFDSKLGVLLDAAERYYSSINCEAVVLPVTTVD